LKASYIILIVGAAMIISSYSINHGLGAIMTQDMRENFAEHGDLEAMKFMDTNHLLVLSTILYILENGGYLVVVSGGIVLAIQIWKKIKQIKKT